MSMLSAVQEALARIVRLEELVDGIYVHTQCMYPSGGFVRVLVRGGQNSFWVSDEGGGFKEIENTGTGAHVSERPIKHLVVPQGLTLHNGVIISPSVDLDALPVAITLVANASKEVA